MGRRVVAAIALGLVGVLAAATAASGDGGPGPGISQGWDGIAQGNERFVALPNGSWTSVEVINRNGGRVLRWMSIKGYWASRSSPTTGRPEDCCATNGRWYLPNGLAEAGTAPLPS